MAKKTVQKVRNPKEELVKFLLQAKVQKYKDGQFEIEFNPAAFKSQVETSKLSETEEDIDEKMFQAVMNGGNHE